MTSLASTLDRPAFIASTRTPGRARLWTGRALSGLAIAFFLFDATVKFFVGFPPVVDAMAMLGYPLQLAPTIAVIALACLALYAIPRSAVLGAVLLTGYLGGAIASQLRVGAPLFANVLFPLYVAALIWGGLYLRDARVRALLAPRFSAHDR
jgi:hypothetical protein